MITDRPRPLPECALCGQPVPRKVARRHDGMCTTCRRVYDAVDLARKLSTPQQLPLPLPAPEPPPPDLTNVVVLDTRRRRP